MTGAYNGDGVMAGPGGSIGKSFVALPEDMRCVLTGNDITCLLSSRLMATLGPSSRDVETMEALLRAGMKLARFDFMWGTPAYHQETLDNLRAAMESTQLACAVVMDTRGRELVVLNRPAGPIDLKAGSTVTLTCNSNEPASATTLPVSSVASFDGIAPGTIIYVGQALFTSEFLAAYLTVQSVEGDKCTCTVNQDATLEGLQITVHVPGLVHPGPPLSPEDVAAIQTFGKDNEVDFVALTYTHSAEDVETVRKVIRDAGLTHTKVMAKIECLTGIKAHREIIDAADVIVLSRGNLGTSLSPEKAFLAVKLLLRAANIGGKPVFVTRVVDSMTEAPRPTRAEATDVANLILDGADGIVLGSETFRGSYPVDAASNVRAICLSAEACFSSSTFYKMQMELVNAYTLTPNMEKSEALASSAVRAADKMSAKLIIVFTVTGNTARMLSKYKPQQPILCVVCPTESAAEFGTLRPQRSSSSGQLDAAVGGLRKVPSMAAFKTGSMGKSASIVARQCLSMRGVIPILADPDLEVDEQLDFAMETAKGMGLLATGDRVVVSKCPRKGKFDLMEEAGVVLMLQVE